MKTIILNFFLGLVGLRICKGCQKTFKADTLWKDECCGCRTCLTCKDLCDSLGICTCCGDAFELNIPPCSCKRCKGN